ncbi:replication-relaxation family protein [bacterium]|nr:replication-relaxation family protein [bacterium]
MRRMTKRDQAILHAVKRLGFVSRDQIQRYLFRCSLHTYWCTCSSRGKTAVNRRLRQLVSAGELQSIRIPKSYGIFEGDIYIPGKNNGAAVKFEEIGVSKHGLLINDIRLWLALSQPEVIKRENIPQEEFHRIADFAFKLEVLPSEVSLRCFLEADRGTESGPQLQAKFDKYREGYLQESDLILFVTTRNTLFTPAQAAARAGLERHVLICNFEENRSMNAFFDAEWFSPFLVRTTLMEYLIPSEPEDDFEL